MASIRARECAEWLFTVGMILLGRTNFTNLDSSLKLLCSLYGTPSMEMKIESKQLNNWKLDLIGTHLWKISWKLCTAFHVLFPKWVQMSYLRYQTHWNLRMDKATWVLYQQCFLILNSGHEKRQIVPNKTFS